jgi:hypothetical protein
MAPTSQPATAKPVKASPETPMAPFDPYGMVAPSNTRPPPLWLEDRTSWSDTDLNNWAGEQPTKAQLAATWC